MNVIYAVYVQAGDKKENSVGILKGFADRNKAITCLFEEAYHCYKGLKSNYADAHIDFLYNTEGIELSYDNNKQFERFFIDKVELE